MFSFLKYVKIPLMSPNACLKGLLKSGMVGMGLVRDGLGLCLWLGHFITSGRLGIFPLLLVVINFSVSVTH